MTVLTNDQAIAIVTALIQQGQIKLPCLAKFNEFREWELSEARPDVQKFFNFDLSERKGEIADKAAELDAHYLKAFINALTTEIDPVHHRMNAWNLVNDLRQIRDVIEQNGLPKIGQK